MPSIFICYRRDDAGPYAGRLHDHLVAEFGNQSVVMDVDFEPGVDFGGRIREIVSAADIVLVLIGPRWTSDIYGKRRIDNHDDSVRLEIRTALECRIRIVPVLVGGTDFPDFESFPDDIRDLTRWNSIKLTDHRWAEDVARLIKAIGPAPPREASASQRSRDASPQVRGDEEGDSRDIFISYVEEDSSTASELARELRAQQQSTWTYEEDGVPGLSYLTQVFQAIDSCRAVVLVASANSVHARQVIKEVEAAHEREKMIIPVRLGLTHQELTASNPILRMAIGTAVTLSMDQANMTGTAKRIANALRLARQQAGM